MQDEVAVRERPALGVLPRETDRDPLLEQRRECERLGLAPVDPSLFRSFPAALELPQELGVGREPGRELEQLLVQCPEALCGDGGLDGFARAARRGRLDGGAGGSAIDSRSLS